MLRGLLAQQLEEIAIAEHQRHRGECARGLRGARDAGDLAFVEAARLLQRERDFLRDEKARLLRPCRNGARAR